MNDFFGLRSESGIADRYPNHPERVGTTAPAFCIARRDAAHATDSAVPT
jgi:hypothetical protein